jgi:hypothetical protein
MEVVGIVFGMDSDDSQQAMFPPDALARPDQADAVPVGKSLWEMGINELAGRNLESAGRSDVNEMLQHGWMLVHVYTLRYREREGPRGPRYIWRERPMAILGRRNG